MVHYRGTEVEYSVFNRKDDTYSLIGVDGEIVAEIKRHEYLSNPYYRNLEHRNGRHRAAPAKDQRRSAGIASQSWRNIADAAAYSIIAGSGGYSNAIAPKSSPGLTATQILQQMQAMQAVVGHPYITAKQMAKMLGEIEKPPLKRDGVIAGEIVGYRCWRIEKGLLRSVYQSDVWKPGEVLEGRELGDWDSRGIHAWRDPASKEYHDYIRSYLNREEDIFARAFYTGSDTRERASRPAMVTGTVFLWGDVVEHERGWRAEFARVRSLDWLYPDETMMGREMATLANLRRLYAVAP